MEMKKNNKSKWGKHMQTRSRTGMNGDTKSKRLRSRGQEKGNERKTEK